MTHLNDQIALGQIREILGLRPSCSLASLVAAVRETKAAADFAGAALQAKKARRIFRAPMDLNPRLHG